MLFQKSAGPPLWGAPGCEGKLMFNSGLSSYWKGLLEGSVQLLEGTVPLYCSDSRFALGVPLVTSGLVGPRSNILPSPPRVARAPGPSHKHSKIH